MRTIVSLAAISPRTAALPAVLASILGQSVPPDEVRLWVSPEPFLFDEGLTIDGLPPVVRDLARTGRIRVCETPNTGPHRKLLPLLHELRAAGEQARIVTADDDTVYPQRWLEALHAGHESTGAAVCFRARRIELEDGRVAPYIRWNALEPFDEVLGHRLLPNGKNGVLLTPGMLDERIYGDDYRTLSRTRSDIWMGAALLARRTPVLKLSFGRMLPDPGGVEPDLSGELPGPPGFSDRGGRPPWPELWAFNRDHDDGYIEATFAHFGLDTGRGLARVS